MFDKKFKAFKNLEISDVSGFLLKMIEPIPKAGGQQFQKSQFLDKQMSSMLFLQIKIDSTGKKFLESWIWT